MNHSDLDIITRTRGEVMSKRELTGENLFLAWGYPTFIVLLSEFLALHFLNSDWCQWLWLGIPLAGTPLMIYFLNKDYKRTHRRTLNENVILMMWCYIGAVCCVAGAVTGFAGIFRQCFFALMGLLCSMGCFMTGIILHYNPKTLCGIIASVLSALIVFFQNELWHWQLLITAAVIFICLILPGHLFKKHIKTHDF